VNGVKAGWECCLRDFSRTGSATVTGPCFSGSSSGLHETLALLTSQLRPDSNHREEMGFLRDVFSEKSLSYLMKVNPRWLSHPPPPSLREALSVPSQPLPCPWKVSNSLVRAFQICCYGGDPACGPRCHHNPGCCVWYLG
jgi:hypothetical protein